METYPIIKINDDVENVLEGKYKISLPIKPDLPAEPIQPDKTSYNYRRNYLRILFNPLNVFCFVGMAFLLGTLKNPNKSSMIYFGFGFCIILATVIFYFNEDDGETEYAKDFKKYLKEYDEFLEKSTLYSKKYVDYRTELVKVTAINAKITNHATRDMGIRELAHSFYQKAIAPIAVDCRSIKKGVSENYFKQLLHDIFGDMVLVNHKVSFGGYEYYPDFILNVDHVSFYVDIEIDEPYIGSNGKPIHYLENHLQDLRDKHFTENFWVVIRFSEKQIITQPQECCNEIFCVIKRFFAPVEDLENYFLTIDRVNPDKRWTKNEAYKFAFNKYRNTYLPSILSRQINTEIFNPLSSSQEQGIDDELPF
ncbi:MAG TPA: hypothetical protein VK154_18105 [Chitinophagales bacterium]|nr:hypothetical protein [Chitinophagales bacterium]